MLGSMLVAIAAVAATVSWPPVDGPSRAAAVNPRDVVVVAGVSRSFVLPPIAGAADNATDWYRFFTGRGLPVERAHLLRDGDVTKENLIAEVKAARAQLGPGGTFWLVFIGHGAPSPAGDDGLLLGADVQPTIRSVESRGVSQRELLELAGHDGATVVAVFDACFSGAASDGSGLPLVPGSQATLPVRRARPAAQQTVLQASERVAGPLPGHNRPAFSYLLLGAARGWADANNDATVTLGEAFSWTSQVLTVAVRDRDQRPVMTGPDDVVLAKKVRERGPRLDEMVAAPAVEREPADSEPEVRTSSSRQSRDPRTFDVVAAQRAYEKKRLTPTGDGFARGVAGEKVALAQLRTTATKTAPGAVQVIDEVDGKGTQALVTGLVIGVVATAAGGAVGVASTMSQGTTTAAIGGGVGVAVGSVVGMMAGLVTWGTMAPSSSDQARVSAARGEIAEAMNSAERDRLGLSDE
jgi:hypothetical protein